MSCWSAHTLESDGRRRPSLNTVRGIQPQIERLARKILRAGKLGQDDVVRVYSLRIEHLKRRRDGEPKPKRQRRSPPEGFRHPHDD
ncbi:MAG: hypothetical protein KW788_01030 [Candidatus Doudnabacteria bacterium]|nr:hypothetical protein [Candidatus Doudnabacteria bacterium]